MSTNILNLKKVNQTLSFFSITAAWILMNMIWAISWAGGEGRANDSGVIIGWSAIFIYLAWIIFINPLLKGMDHSSKLFNPIVFPFVTSLYGGFVYTILIGGLFQDWKIVIMFLPLAFLCGLLFVIPYLVMIRSDNIIWLLIKKPVVKLFMIISPAIFLTFFLIVLPLIIPSIVFRYMPDEIQSKILIRTLAKMKVGDSFSKLDNSLPYYFNSHSQEEQNTPANFSSGGSGPFYEYEIEVKNDTIFKLMVNRK